MLLLNMSNLIELFTFQVDLHSVDEAWSDIEEMHICDEPEGKKTFYFLRNFHFHFILYLDAYFSK